MTTRRIASKKPVGFKVEGDLELFYLHYGNGPELVIFMPAVGGDMYSFLPQMEELAKHSSYTAVSLDMRGHNLSKLNAEQKKLLDRHATIQTFAGDTLALMTHLGFSKAHLVGLSMGAVVAQEAYKQAPQRILSLTLADTWAFVADSDERIAFMENQLKEKSMQESAEELIPFLFAATTKPEYVSRVVNSEGSKDKDVYLATWRDMFSHDYRPLWSSVAVPTLLIGGEEDQVTPMKPLLTDIKMLNVGVRLVTIAGANHFCNLDQPEIFNQHLLQHLHRARPHNQLSLSLGHNSAYRKHFETETVAHGLMRMLNEREIDYFFSNSGTDFTPIIDALAYFYDDPSFKLKPIVCPHENTAIAMAHGYYLLTKKPQAVMAHVNVGTANMGLGLINASRARIPALVLAGKTPWSEDKLEGCRTNFVQWGQDTFDQGGSFREFTKWDYELKGGHNLEIVIDRALAIAQSDPQGPVYLTLPKETLCEKLTALDIANTPRQSAGSYHTDAHSLELTVNTILAAKNPLIITAELGRYTQGPEALLGFCEATGIGVIEHGKRNFFNFPTEHPNHLGFSPETALSQADLIIAIESHVPFIPALAKLQEMPKIIAMGVDPLCQNIPMRSFAADINLTGLAPDTLWNLTQLIREKTNNELLSRVENRKNECMEIHQRTFDNARKEAATDAEKEIITKRFLSHTIGQVVDEGTIIFNEYDLDPLLVPRNVSGSWFENSIASGLGWSLGAALGAQLATDQTILVTLGDGSYLFNTPLSAHYVAAAYNLPIVIVVFNDSGWTTIEKSYRGTTPNGWAQKNKHMPLCAFDLTLNFEKMPETTNGVGFRVESPVILKSTLEEAIKISRKEKKHVLVNVICQRDV
jgi:acetolactate synthase-1/2/3 large subunit